MSLAHGHTEEQREANLGLYSGVGGTTTSSTILHMPPQIPQLPPEIIENIIEQLAPIVLDSAGVAYQPVIRKFLRTCLFVSKSVREFALRRLFQCLTINSAIPRTKHYLLRQLLSPPSELQRMSVIPYLRYFRLIIYPDFPDDTVMDSRSEEFIPLFHAINARNSGCRIASFAFTEEQLFREPSPFFTGELRAAVYRFLTLPTLQSLEIHGGFLVPNFLLGTRVRHLKISCYTLESDSATMEDAAQHPGAIQNCAYPELQSLMTDTTFPIGTITDDILRNVNKLGLTISDTSALRRAEALILKASPSLTNLIISHILNIDHEAIPIRWNINFGVLQALETLDLPWTSYFDRAREATLAARNRPLASLQGLLDTIQNPLPSLTTIRWCFRFFIVLDDIVEYDLEAWLVGNGTLWDELDKKLTSNLYPSLQSVQLVFNFPAFYGDEEVLYDNPDFEIDFFGWMREAYFPRLVASLQENFKFEAEREF